MEMHPNGADDTIEMLPSDSNPFATARKSAPIHHGATSQEWSDRTVGSASGGPLPQHETRRKEDYKDERRKEQKRAPLKFPGPGESKRLVRNTRRTPSPEHRPERRREHRHERGREHRSRSRSRHAVRSQGHHSSNNARSAARLFADSQLENSRKVLELPHVITKLLAFGWFF